MPGPDRGQGRWNGPLPIPGDAGPASPCIRHCCLDERDICLGCGRHVDEITGWHGATAAERQAILVRAGARRRARGR